jgi:hypothetical protein
VTGPESSDGIGDGEFAETARVLLGAARTVLAEITGETADLELGLAVAARFWGDAGDFVVIAEAFVDEPMLVVYSLSPDALPPERTGPILEYIARFNSGLPRANLELDFDELLVKCRTSLDIEELDTDALVRGGHLLGLVRRVILANVATMDMSLPGLRAVTAGTMTPEQAYALMDEED